MKNFTKTIVNLKNALAKQRYSIVLLLCCLAGFSSCVGESDDSTIEREVEHLITIESGLYGQVTAYNDIGDDNSPHYRENFEILIFDHDPDESSTPLFSGKSGEMGFYEIEMENGEYFACTTYLRCTEIEILSGQLLRCDFEFGAGPGWNCFND